MNALNIIADHSLDGKIYRVTSALLASELLLDWQGKFFVVSLIFSQIDKHWD
ncbi:MAG TPA: hypothetical protein VFQ23_20785 [Anaerolineales bacterium]|nr:hypothetical protein [Anaerolineales bacterium]